MLMENTSNKKGFDIFEKITSQDLLCGGHNNKLNIYILKIHDKLFSYDKLYKYILENICQYVFDRCKNLEKKDSKTFILESLDYLREIKSDDDLGAGGELGEILLYLFLEQDLDAPKLFSKVELKTNRNNYINGADGIHFRFRKNKDGKKILQLVIGEAKIENKITKGIKDAFDSINEYISNNIQDIKLLDTFLKDQLFESDEEADILKRYLLGDETEEKETVFGIFVGYSTDYKGINDDNDDYKQRVKEANLNQVLKCKQKIIDYIKQYNISNYEFNFYFLPFHDAQKDRKVIIKQLTEKKSIFSLEEIRNG